MYLVSGAACNMYLGDKNAPHEILISNTHSLPGAVVAAADKLGIPSWLFWAQICDIFCVKYLTNNYVCKYARHRVV